MDSAGNLWGTTYCDGTNSLGNVFKLTNTQNGWVYTSVRDFTGDDDGANPISNVSIDTDGTVYGTRQQRWSLRTGHRLDDQTVERRVPQTSVSFGCVGDRTALLSNQTSL